MFIITEKLKVFIYGMTCGVLVSLAVFSLYGFNLSKKDFFSPKDIAVAVPSPFIYSFSTKEDLFEAGSMKESSSIYWWVDSGAVMHINAGEGFTVQGSLPEGDIWRERYAKENPIDTDNGLHPQNIFRLVTRSTWKNFREEVYFKVNNYEFSTSPSRNESNGLLLFMHYLDSNNLYYAGVRVDGDVVIKKKLNGKYYDLKQEPFFNLKKYDQYTNPNVIPKNVWIGLKTEITTDVSNSVYIKLYIDVGNTGKWKLALEVLDDGKTNGKTVGDLGFAGIRTDFMDVSFSRFKIEEL